LDVAGVAIVGLAVLLATPAVAAKRSKETMDAPSVPDLLLDGGRKLSFERTFSLEREVKPKRSFWTRVVDVIAGEPDFHYLVSPYSVATDSHGRIIVTDVAAAGVHIFDFASRNTSSFHAVTPARIEWSPRSAWRSMRKTIFT